MEEELQDKVSFAMVQSMIIENMNAPQKFSNKLSSVSARNTHQVAAIDDEESLGRATEDFGGYAMDDGHQGSGLSQPLAYERNYDESGIDRSAMKQA